MIAFTIEASLRSKLINRTIVSTDLDEIAQISLNVGAEVPFMRPKELAGDSVLDFPVVKHAIDYLNEDESNDVSIIVLLRPTTPIRKQGEIDSLVTMLNENISADCVRTTRPAIYPPYWMKKINNSGYLEPYHSHINPYVVTRRQDLPKVVMCDGSVEAARVDSILKAAEFPPGKKMAFYRDNVPFIDIDTPEDWEFCEYYMQKNK